MEEQRYCNICGGKMKEGVTVCKKCNADPSEKIVSDCRGMRYANSFVVSTYVNMVLTNRRLLAFEDIKGAVSAGVQAGLSSGGGIVGAIGKGIAGTMDNPIERVVEKGLNGSLKFDVPLSSVTGIETESQKSGLHTFIKTADSKKPFRVVLGTSFDGIITGEMFRNTLANAI